VSQGCLKMQTMRNSSVCLALLAFALLASGCSGVGTDVATPPLAGDGATAAPTADAATRSSPVVVGRPARVFVFAGFGAHCEAVSPPQVTVVQPPTKGDITFEPGQETTIVTSAQGTCIGQKAKGTGVYYTARAGSEGTDSFQVSAKLASGETATRSFEVRITE